MDAVVLNNLPCEIDSLKLQKKLRLKEDSPYLEEINGLAAEAQLIARPKGIFKSSLVETKGEDFVIIEGIKFTSRILRKNLEDSSLVFPYVITCGMELEEWSKKFTDYFVSYCADAIKEMVLYKARQAFMAHIDQEFGLGHAVNMNPGSLSDWPITEQRPLFALLGKVEKLIGVHLTESCLLFPVKTVSGIHFPKEGTFENCQLCQRENCPNRRAPYNEELSAQFC